jgi:sarcosine oxidase, subunit beta
MADRSADAVVIGAGISGAATALELARSGLQVVLLDRYAPAAMASGWTLAGVRQSGRHPAELTLAMAAVRIWATLAEDLDGPTHYRRTGNLRVGRDEGEVAIIEQLIAEQGAAGLEMIRLEGRDVQVAAPAVTDKVLLASLCPSDGQADPKATVASFVRAAERAGAALRFGERVLSIGVAHGRVQGVVTDKGRIAAPSVVLAAGVYGNELLQPLGLHVPMEVMAVTMINSTPTEPVLEQVVGTGYANGSGRQEHNGKFRFGGGHEQWTGEVEESPGPVVRPSMATIQHALATFGELVPASRDSRIESIWAGLIDQTPDALPVLDQPASVEGLSIAMGFSGHGFCLGPLTGKIMADFVHGRTPALNLDSFRLARFAGWNAPASSPLSLHG